MTPFPPTKNAFVSKRRKRRMVFEFLSSCVTINLGTLRAAQFGGNTRGDSLGHFVKTFKGSVRQESVVDLWCFSVIGAA